MKFNDDKASGYLYDTVWSFFDKHFPTKWEVEDADISLKIDLANEVLHCMLSFRTDSDETK